MVRLAIFLDDGGVMTDIAVRTRQWQRMVAEFFVPRLGGTLDAWSAANAEVYASIGNADSWQERMRAAPDYTSLDRQYQIDWLRAMCARVGVPAPANEDCVDLSYAVARHIVARVDAALPGAVDAIRALHEQGYALHTASGEASWHLDGYLRRMGVRECFGRLYGPDLLGVMKDGPHFYQSIFADAGVAPGDALVVDDNLSAVGWAAQTGARVVRIGRASSSGANGALCISCLAEIPALIDSLR